MPSREQYTETYSSVPPRITRPYLIPPIEDDPLRVGVQGRRPRRRGPVPSATAPGDATSVPYTVGGAQAVPPTPPRRSRPAPARDARPSATTVQGAGAAPRPRRQRSVFGWVVTVFVFLVIVVVAARPVAEGILDDLFGGDSVPIEDDTHAPDETDEPFDPDALGSAPSTDELARMLAHADEAAGYEFESFVVIDSETTSDDGTVYLAVLSAFPPFSPDEIFYDREIELRFPDDDPGLSRGDLLHGTFRMPDENPDYTPTVEPIDLESAEYHDLADDIEIAQGETDELGYVGFEMTVTNSADIPMTYAVTLSVEPTAGAGGMDTTAYVGTDEIAPGETVVLEEETLVPGADGGELDFAVTETDRY